MGIKTKIEDFLKESNDIIEKQKDDRIYLRDILINFFNIIKSSTNEEIIDVEFELGGGDILVQLANMTNESIIELLENLNNNNNIDYVTYDAFDINDSEELFGEIVLNDKDYQFVLDGFYFDRKSNSKYIQFHFHN